MAGNLAETSIVIHVRTDGTAEVARTAEEINKLKASLAGASQGIGATGQAASGATGKIAGLANAAQGVRGAFSGAQAGVSGLLGSLSGLEGMAGAILPITVAAVGLGLAFKGISAGITAAAETEQSLVRLDAAVKRTGASLSQTVPEIEAAIQRVFDASAFDDEPLRRAAASFVTITGSAKGAADAIGPISDLAAAMGIDVESAANLVAKATEGMTGQLQRAGIIFSEDEQAALKMATAGERAAIIFDRINRSVGGAAAAELGTYSGQLANMKKQWGEVVEQVGGLFLPTAIKVVAALSEIAKTVGKVITALEKLKSLGIIGGDWALLDKLLERGKAERPFDANLETLKPAARPDPKPILDLSAAYAKAKADALGLQQQADAMFQDLGKMEFQIGITFQPPETDPVKKAIQDVEDKARQMLQSVRDKSLAINQDLVKNLAQLAVLRIQLDDATKDPAKQRSEDVVAIKAQIAAISQLVEKQRAALDLTRQFPDEINKGADAAAKMAGENALAELFKKAKDELDKLNAATDQFVAGFAAKVADLPQFLQGGTQAFGDQLERMRRDAAQNPVSIFGPLSGAELDDALKRLNDGTEKAAKALLDGTSDAGKAFRDQIERTVSTLQQGFERLRDTLADMFSSIALGGVDGLQEALKRAFSVTVTDFGKMLSEKVLTAFGATPTKSKAELETMTPQAVADYQKGIEQKQAIVNAGLAVVGEVGNILNQFKAAKQGQTVSVLGSVIGGAAAGASLGSIIPAIGTLIGAIAGALVGAISALLANSQAKKKQPYAAYGIRGGEAYVEAFPGQERQFENVTNAMKTDMLQRMNAVLEDTTTSYIKLLLKFPLKISAALNLGLSTFDFAPTMDAWTSKASSMWNTFKTALTGGLYDPQHGGGGIFGGHPFKEHQQQGQGDIGNPNFDKTARANFLSDFDNWVKETLPKEIADRFRAQTSQAFTAMGLTVDRFNYVWDKLQGMDPKDAEQILNDTADAIIAFGKLHDLMARLPQQFQLGLRYEAPLDANGFARQRGVSDFQQTLIDQGDNLVKLGMAVFALPFKEQAAAAAQLGQTLSQMGGSLVDFLNGLIELRKGLSDSIAQMRFGIKLDQAATPQAKSDLLSDQLRMLENQIKGAVSLGLNPTDVQRLTQEAMDTIQKLYQLDAKGRGGWADAALAELDKIQQTAIKSMGDAATRQFQTIVDAMQPVIDFFETDVPEALQNLTDAADSAAAALNNVANGGLPNVPKYNEPPVPGPAEPPPPATNTNPYAPPSGGTPTTDTTPPRGTERPGRSHEAFPTPGAPQGAELYTPPPMAPFAPYSLGAPYAPITPTNASPFGGGAAAPNAEAALVVQQSIAEIVKTLTDGNIRIDAELTEVVGEVRRGTDSAEQSGVNLAALLERIAKGQEELAALQTAANAILASGTNHTVSGVVDIVMDGEVVGQVPLDDGGFDRREYNSRTRNA